MKPNTTFSRLIVGALALTNVRSLEGEVARTFSARVAECETIEAVITAIKQLPDQRSNAIDPIRVTGSQLLLQGPQVSINLTCVGDGCDAWIRLRVPRQTNKADAECTLQFDALGRPNAFHTGKDLETFVKAAEKKGRFLEVEAVLLWLREFGAVPLGREADASPQLAVASA